jgi:hypothetical protein
LAKKRGGGINIPHVPRAQISPIFILYNTTEDTANNMLKGPIAKSETLRYDIIGRRNLEDLWKGA